METETLGLGVHIARLPLPDAGVKVIEFKLRGYDVAETLYKVTIEL